jgi:hypothetical protein
VSTRFLCLGVVGLVFVLVLVAFTGTALAAYSFTTHTVDHSMVSGSKHDVSASGGNPCDSCHVPHGAEGPFLWSRGASELTGSGVDGTNTDTGAPGQYSSDIKPLCYSCHDGTQVFGSGSLLTVGSLTVFSENGHFNHRTTAASYVPAGSSTPTGPGQDCDRCHDPHDDSYWDFLRPEFKTETYDQTGNLVTVDDGTHGAKTLYRWSRLIKGGNVCASCHESALPDATAASVAAGLPGSRNVHPVYQGSGMGAAWTGKMVWDTANPGTFAYDPSTGTYVLTATSTTPIVASTPVPGTAVAVPAVWPALWPSSWPADQLYLPASADYQGTRVFSQTTGFLVAGKPHAPALTDGTSVVECESCHAPHGANDATDGAVHILNTMSMGPITGPPAEPGLCSSCHS